MTRQYYHTHSRPASKWLSRQFYRAQSPCPAWLLNAVTHHFYYIKSLCVSPDVILCGWPLGDLSKLWSCQVYHTVAFQNCDPVKSITLSPFKTVILLSLSHCRLSKLWSCQVYHIVAFQNCDPVKSITLSSFKTVILSSLSHCRLASKWFSLQFYQTKLSCLLCVCS